MLVVEVDAIHAEALEAAVTGLLHVIGPSVDAGELAVGPADVSKFGRQHDLVAPPAEGTAHELFVSSDAVHIRRVEEVHAERERAVDGGDGLGIVGRAVEFRHSHAAQSNRRYLWAIPSEFSLLHDCSE